MYIIQFSAKLYEDAGNHVGIHVQPVTVLAIGQVLKTLRHFKTLTRESMGKILKCGIF